MRAPGEGSAVRSTFVRYLPYLARLAPRSLGGRLKDPIFVTGCVRSGKSLLTRSLASHPDVAVFPQEAIGLWHPETYPWRRSRHRDHMPPMFWDPELFTRRSLELQPKKHMELVRAVFGAYQWTSGKQRLVNETAWIAFMVPNVALSFPGARFLNVVRDGRAVAWEWATRLHRTIAEEIDLYRAYGLDLSFEDLLLKCGESWLRFVEVLDEASSTLATMCGREVLFEVRYESLCERPRAVLSDVCEFLELDPSGLPDSVYLGYASRNQTFRDDPSQELTEKVEGFLRFALKERGYLEA